MKIVFSCGVFDLFHQGHKELLELMRANGDKVVIFLHDDKSTYQNKNKFPVQSYAQRKANLQMTDLVDNIVKVELQNPMEYFRNYMTKVKFYKNLELLYVRGDDWKDAPGLDFLQSSGVEILFKEYTQGVSSTKLRSEL